MPRTVGNVEIQDDINAIAGGDVEAFSMLVWWERRCRNICRSQAMTVMAAHLQLVAEQELAEESRICSMRSATVAAALLRVGETSKCAVWTRSIWARRTRGRDGHVSARKATRGWSGFHAWMSGKC